MRPVLEAEEKALASKNGMAAWKVLEIRMRRDRALETEQIRSDELVCKLMDEADAERERIARLRNECRDLEKRAAEMRHAVDDDSALLELFRQIGEGRATAVAEKLGWGDHDDVAE
jgi:hypothetical protein